MTTLYPKMLQVSGPDAGKFLQGQLSCDVLALQDGQTTLGAYCNIKGKVDSMFRLTRHGDEYQLLMPNDLVTRTMQELNKYAVFSKVQIAILTATSTVNELDEIKQKIPEVYATTSGMFFPHDLNLPALGGVSFNKGCYRGQEIVARMHHRGNLKRGLYLFRCAASDMQPGAAVMANAATAGAVVRATVADQQTIGLAVITAVDAQKKLFVLDNEISLDL